MNTSNAEALEEMPSAIVYGLPEGKGLSLITDTGEVRVTTPVLNLAQMLHHYRMAFNFETYLADDIEEATPADWDTRCRELFFNSLSASCKKVCIALSEDTYASMMNVYRHTPQDIIDEMKRTTADELPCRFAFNPWDDKGKGGFKRI